jgi:hypothetical protein
MSNRVLGILIILWFIWAGYIYYHLKYIPGQHQKKIEQQEKIQAEKELEEQPKLVIQESTASEEDVSSTQKIAELKQKNNSYFYVSLEVGNIQFREKINKLDLFLWEEYLGEFPKVERWEIEVQSVINNQEYLFLSLWENKFLYSLNNKKIIRILLNVDVEYVKVWKDTWEFLFKTPVWIFVYALLEDSIEYVHFFKDFVYFLDEKTGKYWYVWIIKNDEEKKLKDLWLERLLSGDSFRSLVVFYSPISKEKKILLESDFNIKHIYTHGGSSWVEVYVIDESWEKYKIENI